MLRGKYQAEQLLKWQETQNVRQQNISFAKEYSIIQKTMALFLHGIFDWHVGTAIIVGNATIA